MAEAVSRKGEGPNLRKANAQREAEGLETSAKVWELKKAGLSFRQIANQLGLSPSGAHEAYKRVIRQLKEELAESADDWLHLHIGRLEEVVSLQIRVARGMDVRPQELRDRDPILEEDKGKENPRREVPATAYPTIEERLAAARDIAKTGESLRKLLGIDAPEKSDVRVQGIIGTVNLAELGGEELLKEADALGAGLKTLPKEKMRELVEGSPSTIDASEASVEVSREAQPQEV